MRTAHFTFGLICFSTAVVAQDDQAGKFAAELSRATNLATKQQLFDLRYKFAAGEKMEWKVEHVSTNKTSMDQTTEVMSSRTQSTTAWKVLSIDSRGQATLEQTIESVNGWQKNGNHEPVSYDSAKDKSPAKEFETMAQRVGRPLMTLLVDERGNTVSGQNETNQYRFGTGSPWIPFPSKPIPVGHKWYEAGEVRASNDDKSVKRIKIQICYELRDVKDGMAKVAFNTEILTPIDDPKIRSQLSQRITRGHMDFDITQGRMVGKQVNWNEKVQGFQGPNSLMHYLGEYTVAFVDPAPKTNANTSGNISTIKPVKIRTRDDAPVFRR